jgi:outer membrane protein OmpA-like peptidoglycan-associated protein
MRLSPWLLVLIACGATQNSRAESDCPAAQEIVAHAKSAVAAADAITLLRGAIEKCPSYDAYELLAEALSQSPHRADRISAVDAFVSADSMAATDVARANTRLHYARLLDDDEDPENANNLIQQARALDPTNPAIASLSSRIDDEVKKPTREQLTRGLWNSMYKPLRIASLPSASRSPVAETPARSSISIPINFETGSVMTDEATSSNITILAHVLADKGHPGQRFVFVGHADARGSEQTNLILSKRRAEAIYQAVAAAEPSLKGRIKVTGRGSSEPLDRGHDERAYRANRRLQVVLDESAHEYSRQ